MRKLVIAAAVLGAFAGTAQAQSSVTLFGVIDTDITHLTAGNNPEGSRTFLTDSGINSSRLGFRGVEDLGGGLKAGFWLEAGLNTENGSGQATSLNNGGTFNGTATGGGGLTFNRRSTVSLFGPLGELRVGRDFAPTFWNAANNDPFGYNGIGRIAGILAETQGAMGPTAVWVSNGISYLTPNTLGGFFAQVTYSLGGNPTGLTNAEGESTKDNGNYVGGNFGYQNGGLYVGLATSYLSLNQTTSTSPTPFLSDAEGGPAVTGVALDFPYGTGGVHTTNLGVSYDFGFVKPDFFYQTSSVSANPQTYETNVYQLGAVVPLGQGEFRISLSHAQGEDYFSGSRANIFGVGYVYNLSKRTALYGLLARVNNQGNYAFSLNSYTPQPLPGNNQSGLSLGVRTSF